jgi:flagellin-like hook-associated protein FlgL
VDGYSAYPARYVNDTDDSSRWIEVSRTLDLSEWKAFTNSEGEAVNCFDKIKELLKSQAADTNLTDADKQKQTQDLAEEIAQKLCAKTYDEMSSVAEYKNHFDRALTDGKYDIIVYDYRDEDKLASSNAADAFVNTGSVARVKLPQPMLEKGTKVDELHPMWIVCSAQFGDVVPLELPLVNAETLGISGYDVSRYSESVTYSDAYLAQLEMWDNDFHLETVNVPERTATSISYTSSVDVDENGEVKVSYKPKTSQVTKAAYSYTVRVHNSEKPVPGEGDVIRTVTYDPDSNRTIKDALEYVMNCRTLLGAQQNRLEHAYNNNQNKHENLSASESRIRDTDIAKEMVDYSNNNILEQAGVSVLSQANQSAQLILQLLQ